MAAPMFQPVGGMDEIAKGFQRAMGAGRITFNAEIQSVHQGDAGVKVVYLDTRSGQKTELAADYVVACLPLNILAGIDINLSPDVMQAVKDIPYSNSAKIGLAMKRRFWEEDDHIFGGHLYSNLPLGEFSYPSYDYFTKKGVLLGLYSNGPVGNLIDQPVAARIEHVLTHASKVHPQIRTEFESGYAVFWKKVQYNLGGYATVRDAARRAKLQQGGQPDRHRVGGRHAALGAGLAGRGGRSRLARADVAARARDARVAAAPTALSSNSRLVSYSRIVWRAPLTPEPMRAAGVSG